MAQIEERGGGEQQDAPRLKLPVKFLKRYAASFAVKMSGAGFAFLLTLVAGRYLGAAGAGIFFMSMTIVFLGGIIGRLGYENIILRRNAADEAGRSGRVARSVWVIVLRVLIASFAISALLYVFAPALATAVFHEPDLSWALRTIAPAIIFFASNVVLLHGLRSAGLILRAAWFENGAIPFLTIAVFLVFHSARTTADLITAYVIATALTALGSGLLCYLHRGVRGEGHSVGRLGWTQGMPFLVISIVYLILSRVDMLILGMFVPAEEVGLYAIAARTAALLPMVRLAMAGVVMPRFAQLHAEGDRKGLAALAQLSTLTLIAIVLPGALIAWMFPDEILSIFGPEFAAASLPFVILVTGQFISVGLGCTHEMLLMSGNEKSLRNILIIAAIAYIGLNLILIPFLGTVGAATATAITTVGMRTVAYWNVQKKFGMSLFFAPIFTR
jgi:O-antigen/teichoic acid export membrane protein